MIINHKWLYELETNDNKRVTPGGYHTWEYGQPGALATVRELPERPTLD